MKTRDLLMLFLAVLIAAGMMFPAQVRAADYLAELSGDLGGPELRARIQRFHAYPVPFKSYTVMHLII